MTNKTSSPDWWAASQVAQTLGSATRRLVALQDTDATIDWALRMSREHSGAAALSYFELAVLCGHSDPKVTAGARLEWNDLLRAVEKLQAAVKVKAAGEKAAAEQATAEKAAIERAAAEKVEAAKAAAAKAEEAVPDAV
jgi:hypothetical protein